MADVFKGDVEYSAQVKKDMSPGYWRSVSTKAMRKISVMIDATAKEKYVPVAKGATRDSMQIENRGQSAVLSSLNQGGTRYAYRGSNASYWAYPKPRVFVPAGKNAGKYRWYHRAHAENEDKIDRILLNLDQFN